MTGVQTCALPISPSRPAVMGIGPSGFFGYLQYNIGYYIALRDFNGFNKAFYFVGDQGSGYIILVVGASIFEGATYFVGYYQSMSLFHPTSSDFSAVEVLVLDNACTPIPPSSLKL